MSIFDIGPKMLKENRLEIATDFRGYYFITKIYEDENPNTSNYELFSEEYYNFDYQEIIMGMPELLPCKRYQMRYHVNINWDYEQTDCDVEIAYTKGSLRRLS